MIKLVMMPPLDELKREFAPRLEANLPEYRVAVPETDEEARREIVDADAAYGWIPPEALKVATKLRVAAKSGCRSLSGLLLQGTD